MPWRFLGQAADSPPWAYFNYSCACSVPHCVFKSSQKRQNKEKCVVFIITDSLVATNQLQPWANSPAGKSHFGSGPVSCACLRGTGDQSSGPGLGHGCLRRLSAGPRHGSGPGHRPPSMKPPGKAQMWAWGGSEGPAARRDAESPGGQGKELRKLAGTAGPRRGATCPRPWGRAWPSRAWPRPAYGAAGAATRGASEGWASRAGRAAGRPRCHGGGAERRAEGAGAEGAARVRAGARGGTRPAAALAPAEEGGGSTQGRLEGAPIS